MTDIELLVREALGRHEAEVPIPDPLEVRPVAIRTRRRQVVNVAAAALVAAVVAIGAISGIGGILRADDTRPAIEPTPTPAPAPPFAPVAFPPATAQPSEPLSGSPLIHFTAEDVTGEWDEAFSVDIYEDGRVITSRCMIENWTPRPPHHPTEDGCVPATLEGTTTLVNTGSYEQRLTPQAVERLRTELLSTGLFERKFESVTTNSTDLVDYLYAELRDGSDRLNVRADYQTLDLNPPSPRVVEGLERIQVLLVDLDASLPIAAWAVREAKAFVPSSYSFWFKTGSVKGLLRDAVGVDVVDALDPNDLPPPADELLTRQGCKVVTLDELRAIVKGFARAGIQPSAEMTSGPNIGFLVISEEPAMAVYFQPNQRDADC